MGLSGCMSCLKYLLFAFNFIFWLAGVAILAVAIYFRVDSSTQNILSSDAEKQELFNGVCYVLMAAGGAITVVGFCGCCGAMQESRMLLTLFAIALFLLLAAEIGAGAYTAANKDEVTDAIDKEALNLWKGISGVNTTSQVVNEIERDLDCCGYNNVGDYCNLDKISSVSGNLYTSSDTGISCVDDGKVLSILEHCPSLVSITRGCREGIVEALKSNLNIVIAVAITIGIIELMGMIFSILLCQAIGQGYTAGKMA